MKNKIIIGVALIIVFLTACSEGTGSASMGNSSTNSGTGGSMARFTIVDNMLYAISGNNVQLVNIDTPSDPVLWNKILVDFGIETLFTSDGHLFIGSQSGVFIYDYSNPEFPEYVSEFTHARSCDPVVTQGNYAFVTLRGNVRCFGNVNQLDILDVSDITHPKLVKSYAMQEPFGLGIADEKLFICDGEAGLKVFDVTQKENIKGIETLSEIKCYDVIPYDGSLIVSSEQGILQFNHTAEKLIALSEIPSFLIP